MGTFLGQHTHTFLYTAPKAASAMAVGSGERCGTSFYRWLSHCEAIYMYQRGQ